MRTALPTLLLLAAACAGDETISGYANREAVYVLQEIDGRPYPERATISFPEQGVAVGVGACNRWRAAQSAPYPWFDLGPIAATRRACPALRIEAGFFLALGEMTLAEVQGPMLILSNDAGRELVFRAAQP